MRDAEEFEKAKESACKGALVVSVIGDTTATT